MFSIFRKLYNMCFFFKPSDDDSEFDDSEKSPSSPPPPPFGGAHYVNNDVRQSWKYPTNSNAYAYTDSEAESSHYGISLQGGHVLRDRDLLSNRAGSRAPVTGFSSFVWQRPFFFNTCVRIYVDVCFTKPNDQSQSQIMWGGPMLPRWCW